MTRSLPGSIGGCALALILVAAGCSDSLSPGVTMTMLTDRSAYLAGTDIEIQILAHVDLGYNGCSDGLEEKAATRWLVVAGTSSANCVDIGNSVSAGGTGRLKFMLPSNLIAGTYRWRLTGFRREDGSPIDPKEMVTNEFSVQAASPPQ